MLSKNLHFIHNFDAKMHYSMHYSLLENKESDNIHLHDSVQHKKCKDREGRWSFLLNGKDYSCGIYHVLEIIRQGIFSAMENNKNRLDLALLPSKFNPDICYAFNYEQEFKVARPKCGCDTPLSKRIFFKVVKPVLEELFKNKGFQITSKIIKNKIVRERFGPFLLKFKRDLNVVRIEWPKMPSFNEMALKPETVEAAPLIS